MIAHCPNNLNALFCGMYSWFRFSSDNLMIFIFLFNIKQEGILKRIKLLLAELLRLEIFGTEVYKLLSHC